MTWMFCKQLKAKPNIIQDNYYQWNQAHIIYFLYSWSYEIRKYMQKQVRFFLAQTPWNGKASFLHFSLPTPLVMLFLPEL